MSTTIAVAIITAFATIAGGVTAGTIGLITQNRQLKLQRETERRKVRRDLYVTFLAKLEAANNVRIDIWHKPPPSSKSISPLNLLYEPEDHFQALNIAIAAVYLEGPKEVAEAAGKIMGLCNDDSVMIKKIAASNIGRPEHLDDLGQVSIYELQDKMDGARSTFINEARRALGDWSSKRGS